MGKKRKHPEEKPKVEGEYDLPTKHLKSVHVETEKKRLIIILHGAQLETVKVRISSCVLTFKQVKCPCRLATRLSF